jgi:hypothetical protein
VRTALAAAVMLLFGLVAAQAFLEPQFCAAQFQLPRSEMKQQGISALEIYITDGRTLHQKMRRDQWVRCMCPKGDQPCDCCDYDLEKTCAEVRRINTTTMDRFHYPACERRQQ